MYLFIKIISEFKDSHPLFRNRHQSRIFPFLTVLISKEKYKTFNAFNQTYVRRTKMFRLGVMPIKKINLNQILTPCFLFFIS